MQIGTKQNEAQADPVEKVENSDHIEDNDSLLDDLEKNQEGNDVGLKHDENEEKQYGSSTSKEEYKGENRAQVVNEHEYVKKKKIEQNKQKKGKKKEYKKDLDKHAEDVGDVLLLDEFKGEINNTMEDEDEMGFSKEELKNMVRKLQKLKKDREKKMGNSATKVLIGLWMFIVTLLIMIKEVKW